MPEYKFNLVATFVAKNRQTIVIEAPDRATACDRVDAGIAAYAGEGMLVEDGSLEYEGSELRIAGVDRGNPAGWPYTDEKVVDIAIEVDGIIYKRAGDTPDPDRNGGA